MRVMSLFLVFTMIFTFNFCFFKEEKVFGIGGVGAATLTSTAAGTKILAVASSVCPYILAGAALVGGCYGAYQGGKKLKQWWVNAQAQRAYDSMSSTQKKELETAATSAYDTGTVNFENSALKDFSYRITSSMCTDFSLADIVNEYDVSNPNSYPLSAVQPVSSAYRDVGNCVPLQLSWSTKFMGSRTFCFDFPRDTHYYDKRNIQANNVYRTKVVTSGGAYFVYSCLASEVVYSEGLLANPVSDFPIYKIGNYFYIIDYLCKNPNGAILERVNCPGAINLVGNITKNKVSFSSRDLVLTGDGSICYYPRALDWNKCKSVDVPMTIAIPQVNSIDDYREGTRSIPIPISGSDVEGGAIGIPVTNNWERDYAQDTNVGDTDADIDGDSAGNGKVGDKLLNIPVLGSMLKVLQKIWNAIKSIPDLLAKIWDAIKSIPDLLSKTFEKIKDIPNLLSKIWEKIKDIADTIAHFFDIPNDVSLDFTPLKIATEKFPFCIPWDFINCIRILKADSVVPKFEVDFGQHCGMKSGKHTIVNFEKFEKPVKVLRFFILLIFVRYIIVKTRDLIRG